MSLHPRPSRPWEVLLSTPCLQLLYMSTKFFLLDFHPKAPQKRSVDMGAFFEGYPNFKFKTAFIYLPYVMPWMKWAATLF